MHLGDVALNAVFGLILGLGYGKWDTAAAQFGGGLLLGELTLFSHPNRLCEARDRYELSDFALAPTVSSHGLGLKLVAVF